MSIFDALTALLTVFAGSIGDILVLLSAVGTIAMALTQIVKPYLHPRFFERHYTQWFSVAEQEAFELQNSVFELEIADICKYLLRRADGFLDYPDDYEVVIASLGSRAQKSSSISSDIVSLREAQGAEPTSLSVAVKHRVRDAQSLAIRHYQLDLERGWRRLLHAFSFGVSAILVVGGFWLMEGLKDPADLLFALIFSILAAVVAPVARDMIKVVERARSIR